MKTKENKNQNGITLTEWSDLFSTTVTIDVDFEVKEFAGDKPTGTIGKGLHYVEKTTNIINILMMNNQ